MRRFAVVGGGIAGLAAAYELEKQRRAGAELGWTLYEISDRLGGTVETTSIATSNGEFIIEGGPDAWVTEKPWARDLAMELGLEAELIVSNDATRKTYIRVEGKLQAMPDRMRMMVPEDLETLKDSPLFSAAARQAYADELQRADELRNLAPEADESVASFVQRHFGGEVLDKVGAPLLSGVFGGDVNKLSVRAVMPAFVAMEREHGSLIAAVQAKARERGTLKPQPTFTTLRRGLGSLIEALRAYLPTERIVCNAPVRALRRDGEGWQLGLPALALDSRADHVMLATPAHVTQSLLSDVAPEAIALLPEHASSAVLAAFAWESAAAAKFTLPPGFGLLVPQVETPQRRPQILACTFVDQKFLGRTPPGGRLIRVFYGGNSFDSFSALSDDEVALDAMRGLEEILGFGQNTLPPPEFHSVSRWPQSLPQYDVGHQERMTQLRSIIDRLGGLDLLGNSYHGVGLPDLVRDGRAAALKAVQDLAVS